MLRLLIGSAKCYTHEKYALTIQGQPPGFWVLTFGIFEIFSEHLIVIPDPADFPIF